MGRGLYQVRRLKFTNFWVRSFLRRNCFTRRRISTVIKRIPSDEEVKQAMQDIQEVQKQYNIAAEYVVEEDACQPARQASLLVDCFDLSVPVAVLWHCSALRLASSFCRRRRIHVI